jgi:23S rRNA pseudouridine955/2504/2580 synthase
MNQKIKDRELTKLYLCVVLGRLSPPQGRLEGYIFKDEVKKQVYVRKRPEPGAKTAITDYRTLAVKNGLSLVECDLITGRTHQIRAQFAAAGHPLLGDGKYGSERENRRYGRHGQALYSYKLVFQFTTPAGPLEPLNGKTFQVEDVEFVKEYFSQEKAPPLRGGWHGGAVTGGSWGRRPGD